MKIWKSCRLSAGLLIALATFGYLSLAAQEPVVQDSDARSLGVQDSVRPVVQGTKQNEDQPQEKDRYRYRTTRWVMQEIDLQSLSKRLKSFGFEIPANIQGSASIDLMVGVPINALTTLRAYQFRGAITARDVQVDQAKFSELSATVTYEDGKLKLTNFRGSTKSGKFYGTASASVYPRGNFAGELTVEKLKLGPLFELLGEISGRKDLPAITGIADGAVKVSGKFDQLTDVSGWNASGRLQIQNFSVAKSSIYSVNIADVTLDDRKINVPRFNLTSPEHPSFFLNGDINFQVDKTQAFKISLRANDMPTADVLGVYFPNADDWADGKIDLLGTAHGEWMHADTGGPRIAADVMVASPRLRLWGIDLGLIEHHMRLTSNQIELTPLFPETGSERRKIELARARYAIDDQRFAVEHLDARIFGGELQANAAFVRTAAGTHRIAANWQGIDPSIRLPLGSSNIQLSGRSTGSIRWSAPADRFQNPAFHKGKAVVEYQSIQLDGEDLGSLSAQAEIRDSQFGLVARGDLLGGEIQLTSQADLRPELRWADVRQIPLRGDLILDQLAVGDAIRAVTRSKNRRYAGRLDGRIGVQLQLDAQPRWNASLVLRELSIDRKPISRRLNARLFQQDSTIEIESIEGSYANGDLQANGSWSLADGKRLIKVGLVRAQGRSLLLPFSKQAEQWVDGLVSGRASIVGTGSGPFDGVRVMGSVRVVDGQAFGAPVGDAHSPFRARLNRSPLRWDANFPAVNARVARGSVRGRTKLSSQLAGSGINLDSNWRITHVDFENLLSKYLGTTTIGRGDVSGQLSLSGRRIKSLDDLHGGFHFKLGGTDASAVPGLSAAGSMLGVLSLAGVRFTDGEADGQIGKGAVQIERLALASDRLRVDASGRVFLAGPRMDIRATISTGNFQGQQILPRQLSQLTMASPVPLVSLNQWFSDRSFVVDYRGTVRDPQVRLLTAETIQINLRRRLIQQATGLVFADALLLDN